MTTSRDKLPCCPVIKQDFHAWPKSDPHISSYNYDSICGPTLLAARFVAAYRAYWFAPVADTAMGLSHHGRITDPSRSLVCISIGLATSIRKMRSESALILSYTFALILFLTEDGKHSNENPKETRSVKPQLKLENMFSCINCYFCFFYSSPTLS